MGKRYKDSCAPDGIFAHGTRRVRFPGYVKVAKMKYYSGELIQFIGRDVTVQMGDYWMGYVECFDGKDFICNAEP